MTKKTKMKLQLLLSVLLLISCFKINLSDLKVSQYGECYAFIAELIDSKIKYYKDGDIEEYLKHLDLPEDKITAERRLFYNYLEPNFYDLDAEINDIVVKIVRSGRKKLITRMHISNDSLGSEDTLNIDLDIVEADWEFPSNLKECEISVTFSFLLKGKLKGSDSYMLIQKNNFEYRISIKDNQFRVTEIRIL